MLVQQFLNSAFPAFFGDHGHRTIRSSGEEPSYCGANRMVQNHTPPPLMSRYCHGVVHGLPLGDRSRHSSPWEARQQFWRPKNGNVVATDWTVVFSDAPVAADIIASDQKWRTSTWHRWYVLTSSDPSRPVGIGFSP